MIRKTNDRRAQVRALLRDLPGGMTPAGIARALGMNRQSMNVRRVLESMPDAYIYRWWRATTHDEYTDVWRVVTVPEHCPHPMKGET